MIEEVFVSPFNSVSVSDLQLALLPLCSTFLQPYAHRWSLNTLTFEPYCNEPTHHHGRPHAVCRIGPRHESSSFPFFSLLFPFISPSSGGEMGPPGPFTLQYGDAMPCLHRESTAEFRLLFTAPLPNGHNTTNQR